MPKSIPVSINTIFSIYLQRKSFSIDLEKFKVSEIVVRVPMFCPIEAMYVLIHYRTIIEMRQKYIAFLYFPLSFSTPPLVLIK